MYLETVDIYNFRGIRHLKVNLEEDASVLIGENSWGKSSLLSVLWLMLGNGERLCKFDKSDLYIPIKLLVEEAFPDDKTLKNKNARFKPYQEYKRPALNFEQHKAPYEVADEAVISPDFKEDFPFDLNEYPLNAESISYLNENLNFMEEDTFKAQADEIVVNLIFAEKSHGQDNLQYKNLLNKAWSYCKDGTYRIQWQVIAYENKKGEFVTEHKLVDENLNEIECKKEELIKKLIHLNPVLRLRDGRMNFMKYSSTPEDVEINEASAVLSKLNDADGFKGKDVIHSLSTLESLTSKYLVNSGRNYLKSNRYRPRSIKDMVNRPVTIESLNDLRQTLNYPGMNKTKLLVGLLTGALVASNPQFENDDLVHPILVIEDIEGRFHPSLLLSLWSIIDTIPLQKIVTTNSSDLLTAVPLTVLRRLCKQYYDTRCYQVNEKSYSADDMRRIAFHVRINRPNSLFARCWILVEGETEIWIMTQIASILGFSLYCNGIRPVEFAQCGLHPLMKLARQLGISFFVITDGDESGRKYAQSVTSFVGGKSAKDHLSVLPHLDIEHYLYFNGYKDVFVRCSGISGPIRKGTTADKIIDLAIHRQSKPGLALAVMEEMQRRGIEGVPPLFKHIFTKIKVLSQNEYGID